MNPAGLSSAEAERRLLREGLNILPASRPRDTLAMAILPEEFPLVLTVFLALGAWRIGRQGVLTRRIPAVEMLGATTVLCVDKTGTLTENRMSVAEVFYAGQWRKPDTQAAALLEVAALACELDPFDLHQSQCGVRFSVDPNQTAREVSDLYCVKVLFRAKKSRNSDGKLRKERNMKVTVLSAVLLTLASAQVMSAEVTYRKDIRPLMVQKCLFCHGTEAPYLGDFDENKKKFEAMFKGPRMDTYADLVFFIGWPDTGAIMRRLDDGKSTSDGKPGNMYQNLGATEEERQKNLNLFKEWVGKDAWKLNRWEARGKVPAITKQDLDNIKVKY